MNTRYPISCLTIRTYSEVVAKYMVVTSRRRNNYGLKHESSRTLCNNHIDPARISIPNNSQNV